MSPPRSGFAAVCKGLAYWRFCMWFGGPVLIASMYGFAAPKQMPVAVAATSLPDLVYQGHCSADATGQLQPIWMVTHNAIFKMHIPFDANEPLQHVQTHKQSDSSVTVSSSKWVPRASLPINTRLARSAHPHNVSRLSQLLLLMRLQPFHGPHEQACYAGHLQVMPCVSLREGDSRIQRRSCASRAT